MKTHFVVSRRSGFSLTELMVVIAILGFLTAIVLPNLSFMSEASQKAKDKRHAQMILLTYTTGAAAGVSWPEGDVETQVAGVIVGQKPGRGGVADRLFQATVEADEVPSTYPYIGQRADGTLFYDSTGGQSATGHGGTAALGSWSL